MSEQQTNNEGRRHAGGLSDLYHTWRYLFWLIGFTVLVLLFYAEENWRGYRAWENYKQQMAARGESFDPASFIPPQVPDDQNFAMTPALSPLFQFVPGTQRWRDTNAPRLFQDLTSQYEAAAAQVKPHPSERLNSWVRNRTDLNLWAAAFTQPSEAKHHGLEPLRVTNFSSRDAATRVIDALSDFKPVLDELQDASSRPYSRFNLRYEEDNPAGILLPHLAKIKFFCQVLQLRASAHLALGHTDDALRDINLMLYLVDSTRSEPIIISQFVRMAELQLVLQPLAEGMGQWTEPQLRELQDHLSRVDFCADTERALESERVLLGGGVIEYLRRSHQNLRMLEDLDGASQNGNSNGGWAIGGLFSVAPTGWLYLEQLNYSRIFGQNVLPVINVTNRQIRPGAVAKADEAIGKILETTPVKRFFRHQFFSALLLPSLSKAAQKAAVAQTAVDAASIACALERYRLAHGQFPDSLDKLAPNLMATLPHDIINGNALSYRLEPGGHYVVYSAGWNEKDDGGLIHHNKSGEADLKEGDWVWTDQF